MQLELVMIYIYPEEKQLVQNKKTYIGRIDGRYPFIIVVNEDVDIFDYQKYCTFERYIDAILKEKHKLISDGNDIEIEKPDFIEYGILSHHQKTSSEQRTPGYIAVKFPNDAMLADSLAKIPKKYYENEPDYIAHTFSMTPLMINAAEKLLDQKKRLNHLLKHLYETNIITRNIRALKDTVLELKSQRFPINDKLTFTADIDIQTILINKDIKLALIMHGDQCYLVGRDKDTVEQKLIPLNIPTNGKFIRDELYRLCKENNIKYCEDEKQNLIDNIDSINAQISQLKDLQDKYISFQSYIAKIVMKITSEDELLALEENLFHQSVIDGAKKITELCNNERARQKNELYDSHMLLHAINYPYHIQLVALGILLASIIFICLSAVFSLQISALGAIVLGLIVGASLGYLLIDIIDNAFCKVQYIFDDKHYKINDESSKAINSFGLFATPNSEQIIQDEIKTIMSPATS